MVVQGRAHVFADLGHGTNHDAEWLGLIRAMEFARTLGLSDVELIGDSLAVVREANAALQGASASGGHAATFLALAAACPPRRVRWIKREQNLAGIALARRHPR